VCRVAPSLDATVLGCSSTAYLAEHFVAGARDMKYPYYYYSTWFYLLIITSILFHGFYPKSIVMNLIDKIPILGIVATGSYIFYTKTNVVSYPKKITFGLFIIGSFVYVLLIFFYGFLTEQFCFNPDQKIANTYHAMIHLVSSISHHAIIMM